MVPMLQFWFHFYALVNVHYAVECIGRNSQISFFFNFYIFLCSTQIFACALRDGFNRLLEVESTNISQLCVNFTG